MSQELPALESEPQMCEVCFSTSHRTEDCDVVREREMLKNMAWLEELVNGSGMRSSRLEQSEGLTIYEIFTADGAPLGKIEIADEPRALKPEGSKAGTPWGLLSFHFEAPNGSSYKTGPAGLSTNIEDILGAGIHFLREERERIAEGSKELMRHEFDQLEHQGSAWNRTIPGYEQMSISQRAEEMGLTVEEWQKNQVAGFDYGSLYSDLQTNEDRHTLHQLWTAWQEGRQADAAPLEARVRSLLGGQKSAQLIDRIKQSMPEINRIQDKAMVHELGAQARLFNISPDELAFLKDTIDATKKQFDWVLKGDARVRFRSWMQRNLKSWQINLPEWVRDVERLGVEGLSDADLEAQIAQDLNEEQRAQFAALKARVPRYQEIREKIIGSK